MTKITAAFLALAFTAAVPGMALAECAGHMKTATTSTSTVDASGTTTPMTPIPTPNPGG